jgi:hypothetical protein
VVQIICGGPQAELATLNQGGEACLEIQWCTGRFHSRQ